MTVPSGCLAAALALVPLASAFAASLDGYPSRAVRIIVPLAPGGTVDTLARAMSSRLSERWTQPVLVDNRPGGNGNIGMSVGKAATPDGHTIVFTQNGIMGIAPNLGPLPFDPVRDFAPIGLLATGPLVLAVPAASPVRTLRDFIALSKAKPGQVTYASSSIGGVGHLTMELLSGLAGVEWIHVPYKGGGPAVSDTIAGHVQSVISGAGAVVPHAKTGRLRIVVSSGAKRSGLLPDIPTIAESGFPGFDAVAWYAVVAPLGIAAPIVSKLNADIGWSLAQPEVHRQLTESGFDVATSTPAELALRIREEVRRWGPAVKAAKLI